MDEHQKNLSKMLGVSRGLTGSGEATWAEIYEAVGALKERANWSRDCCGHNASTKEDVPYVHHSIA